MEKHIIQKMNMIVKNKNMNVLKDFTEDKKDLKEYTGDFLWGYSEQGTNLIFSNSPFSYLQVENMKTAKNCYVCIAGHLKKVTKKRALAIVTGLYSRNRCA